MIKNSLHTLTSSDCSPVVFVTMGLTVLLFIECDDNVCDLELCVLLVAAQTRKSRKAHRHRLHQSCILQTVK